MSHNDNGFMGRLFGRGSSSTSPPPMGQNREFDRYCNEQMDGLEAESTDYKSLRIALWATWQTQPPSRRDDTQYTEDDEDEELARALALSVQGDEQNSRQPSRQGSVIPIDDGSEEDEDLQRAIALSQAEERAPKRPRREETPEEEKRMLEEAMAASLSQNNTQSHLEEEMKKGFEQNGNTIKDKDYRSNDVIGNSAVPDNSLPAILSDRAQMEKERLARQQARAANQGQSSSQAGSSNSSKQQNEVVPPSSSPKSVQTTFNRISSLPDIAKKQRAETTSSGNAASTSSANGKVNQAATSKSKRSLHPLQSSGSLPRDAAGEYFLDGELRHTSLSIGEPSQQPVFSLPDVVGEICFFIMCSFVYDDEWLETIIPNTGSVSTIMIRPAVNPNHKGKVQVQENGSVYAYPKMMGDWGSAHMKFFFIWYKTGRLRVAISTANAVPYDWDWIENSVFVQDFMPVKDDRNSARSTAKGRDFIEQFRSLLVHVKVHRALEWHKQSHPFGQNIPLDAAANLKDLARKYDYSRVTVRIVMSVAGKYTGQEEMIQYGMCRLASVLKEENWVPINGKHLTGEYQGSSLGSYTIDWLDTFYQFMNGKDPASLSNRPKPKQFPPVKVLFPSLATVDDSVLKREGGGTMFVGQSWKTVTKHLFHDANSKRGGVLMHAKVMIALFEDPGDRLGAEPSETSKKRKYEEEGNDVGGWVYVGSHNFTPSAWGNARLNDKPQTLSMTNYELGIVFPLPRENAKAAADLIAPYKRPARQYSAKDIPWDQKLKGQSVLTSDGTK